MAGRSLFKIFYALLVVLLHTNPSLEFNSGVLNHSNTNSIICIEREREALLAFKQGFIIDDDSQATFSSWGTEAEKQDCCRSWEGVHCDNETGHVISLDLGGLYLQGKMISPKLIELQHLELLDLNGIDFNGSQFPHFIGSLTNLRYLDLSANRFGGHFPCQVGNLTDLQYLDLSGNSFANVKNLNWLPHLSALTYLDLSGNNLSNVFDWPKVVNKLSKLRNLTLKACDLPPIHSSIPYINSSNSLASVIFSNNHLTSSIFQWLLIYNTTLVHLDLSSNHLTGTIPNFFGNMNSLAHLSLDFNQFEGGIPHSFAKLCSLRALWLVGNNLSGQFSEFVQILSKCAQNSLEILDLSYNDISGSLPNLTNFLCLESLSLSGNLLSGRIPESMGQMSKLENLDLSMNSLKGEISETHFSKLSNLQGLVLSFNPIVLNFHSDWVPPFQLDSILLGDCKTGPDFPKWLQTQKNYSYLDISHSCVVDILPSWFSNMPRKVMLVDISDNQIKGTLTNSRLEFANHPELNFSSNQLEGSIPSFLSKASALDLSNNKLTKLISFLCATKVSNLTYLDLSSNHVSGDLPDCWMHFENLVFLDLSNNTFSGKIPTTMGFLSSIQTLKLNDNRFEGELPSSLMNCKKLQVLVVGENKLSGLIPEWLGIRLANLVILVLRSNNFFGSMPPQLCHLTHIQIFDFSMNKISGTIPKCLNNLTMFTQRGGSSLNISHGFMSIDGESSSVYNHYEDEVSLIWKGMMSKYKSTLGLVKIIDLSNNSLTGEIPSEITYLVGLVSLNLSTNRLTGQIPLNIGKLQSLDSLDLSSNLIDGRIPTSLSQIDRLAYLDISDNNLSGPIPKGTQLQSFDSSAYAGNPQLCGPPLPKTCFPKGKGAAQNQEHEDGIMTQGFYISLGLGFAVGFWGVCGTLLCTRSCRYTYFNFLNFLRDWLYVRATIIRQRMVNRQMACL